MFLRKKKKQNGCDKDSKVNSSNGRSSLEDEPEVDSEGYTIRKPHDLNGNGHKQLDKFYSSSGSEDSDTEAERKLHFEIKPRNGGLKLEPSLAELKETVKQLSISSLHTQRRQFSLNSTSATFDESTVRQSGSHLTRHMVNSSNTSNSIGSTLNGSLSSLSVLGSGPTDPLNSTTIHEIPRPHSTQSHLLEDASSTAGTSGHSSTPVTQSRKVANDFPNGHAFTVGSQVQQDRYAALRDIFDEVNTQWNSAPNRETELLASAQNAPGPQQKDICEEKYSLPNAGNHVISENLGDNPLVKSLNLSKSISSFSVVSASGNSVLTSVRKPMPLVNGRNGTQSILPTMPRCESYSNLSLEMRMTPVSLGSSRGPSPMTGNGVIPIAIAIQESISARFKGADESKCNSVIYGDLKIAFPAGILQTLINNPTLPALRFKLTNASKIAKVLCNKDLIVECSTQDPNNNPGNENSLSKAERLFELRLPGLIQCLRRLFEQAPFARYYNVDVLKYQLNRSTGATSCPLQVVTHWKCELQSTCLKIDYKYNSNALSTFEPLRNVTFTATVDAQVIDMQSKPNAIWNPNAKQITWNVDNISRQSDQFGLGSLRAKFNIMNGPTSPGPVSVQMTCKNASFSGLNFEPSTGYRVSLFKKQIMTGRYISEADSTINYACV